MEATNIQLLADETRCDLRIIEPWHYRLLDEYGNYVVDIYIKKDKRGDVIKNTLYEWGKFRWGVVKGDIKNIIKHNKHV